MNSQNVGAIVVAEKSEPASAKRRGTMTCRRKHRSKSSALMSFSITSRCRPGGLCKSMPDTGGRATGGRFPICWTRLARNDNRAVLEPNQRASTASG